MKRDDIILSPLYRVGLQVLAEAGVKVSPQEANRIVGRAVSLASHAPEEFRASRVRRHVLEALEHDLAERFGQDEKATILLLESLSPWIRTAARAEGYSKVRYGRCRLPRAYDEHGNPVEPKEAIRLATLDAIARCIEERYAFKREEGRTALASVKYWVTPRIRKALEVAPAESLFISKLPPEALGKGQRAEKARLKAKAARLRKAAKTLLNPEAAALAMMMADRVTESLQSVAFAASEGLERYVATTRAADPEEIAAVQASWRLLQQEAHARGMPPQQRALFDAHVARALETAATPGVSPLLTSVAIDEPNAPDTSDIPAHRPRDLRRLAGKLLPVARELGIEAKDLRLDHTAWGFELDGAARFHQGVGTRSDDARDSNGEAIYLQATDEPVEVDVTVRQPNPIEFSDE